MNKRTTLKLLLFLLFFQWLKAQTCDQELIYQVCDMENIDHDNDLVPDGIINLYDITATTSLDGVWQADPAHVVSLDTSNGDVYAWELKEATNIAAGEGDDYYYYLFNADCGDTPAYSVQLIMGAHSGTAVEPSSDGINVEICSHETLEEINQFNLFEALHTNDIIPSAHKNGQWEFVDYLSDPPIGERSMLGSLFSSEIEYQPGLPLIDKQGFRVKYVVSSSDATCDSYDETFVNISVVRQVSSGESQLTNICESTIENGDYNLDINLRDDLYLQDEDEEGIWDFDESAYPWLINEIENEQDSQINLEDIYNDVVKNLPSYPRFGCFDFSAEYKVDQRSTVCSNQQTSVEFTIHEKLRPFSQSSIPQVCANQSTNLSLYSYIQFAQEDDVTFNYANDNYIAWRLVSGPETISFLNSENSSLYPNAYLGQVNFNENTPGTYVFEYGVHPNIVCNNTGNSCNPYQTDPNGINYCDFVCAAEFAQISVEVLAYDYAGENTTDLIFCESEGQIDLFEHLEDNGEQTIVETGIWTDSDGEEIDSIFEIPTISNQQTFSFTYTTTHATTGCIDTATLSFNVFEYIRPFSQNDTDPHFCINEPSSINLYDFIAFTEEDGILYSYSDTSFPLATDPYKQTSWKFISGPSDLDLETYNCSLDGLYTHLGTVNTEDAALGTYVFEFGVHPTINNSANCCSPDVTDENQTFYCEHICSSYFTQITIEIVDFDYAGEDTDELEFCESLTQINLLDELETDNVTSLVDGGIWTDTLTGNTIDVNNNIWQIPLISGSQDYNFTYITTTEHGCQDSATLSFTVFEYIRPFTQNDQTAQFCASDFEVGESVSLYDFIDFTDGFSYLDTDNQIKQTNWQLVSATDPLGLTLFECDSDTLYSHEGNVYLHDAPSGIYIFEFGVDPNINLTTTCCDPFALSGSEFDCSHVCVAEKVDITIEILGVDYAGDDNTGLQFCETNESIDLFDYLGTNGSDAIVTSGEWTNSLNEVVSNIFTFVEVETTTSYTFTYTTTNTLGCQDQASVSFEVYPDTNIGEGGSVIVCSNDLTLNLYDLLEGTTDQTGVWEGPFAYSSNDYLGTFIDGDLDLPVLHEGIYTYTIPGNEGCTTEKSVDLLVEIELLYAGEDSEAVFCTLEGEVSLLDYINVDGFVLTENGVWTDSLGDTVENLYTIPTVTEVQELVFTYTVTSDNNCQDSSQLTVTVYPETNIGEGSTVAVCSNDLTVNLYDYIVGTTEVTGIWTGPNDYVSSDYLGTFIDGDTSYGELVEGLYVYEIPGNEGCTASKSVSVFVQINNPVVLGEDVNVSICKSNESVNLFTLLDELSDRSGYFEDTMNTGALDTEANLSFSGLTEGVYEFAYVVDNQIPCNVSSSTVSVEILEVPDISVEDQEFCILDAARLSDLEVEADNYNWYENQNGGDPIIDDPVLIDEKVYYITNVDTDLCESGKTGAIVNILNIGELSEQGELCTFEFQDGVSPDGNFENDTFQLTVDGEFNLPEAFPNFTFEVFNRYGTKVYEGNANSEEFSGVGNRSLRVGDDLSAGTYFYIFNPNLDPNQPIQGSFYLSK